MDLEFVNLPPKSPGTPAKYMDEAAALRENPGKWVRLVEANGTASAGSIASSIRTGIYRAFRPTGDFEATSRGSSVYVRYVGGAA